MIRSPVPLDTETVGKKDLEKVQVIYKLKHLLTWTLLNNTVDGRNPTPVDG